MFTVLSITHRAHGCECGMYAGLIGIYIHIVTQFYCVGGVLFEVIKLRGGCDQIGRSVARSNPSTVLNL